jgi:hypothetical protein
MARRIIDIGVKGNDGTGDPIREAFRKINDNFQELYTKLGLAQGLTLISLSDTPNSYLSKENNVLVVNKDENGVEFKKLVGGAGITVDTDGDGEILINAAFANISTDASPQLGGPLNAFSGTQRYSIGNLPKIESVSELRDAVDKISVAHQTSPDATSIDRLAVNKSYADTKISRAGIDSQEFIGVDGEGNPVIVGKPEYGVMTGPLVLSRDPITEDDELWDGKVAATKRYVDNASYSSNINLHVSTDGDDSREDIPQDRIGRALAYAFKTVEAAVKRAEELMLEAPFELGPYRKLLTFNNGTEFCTLTSITRSVNDGTGATARAIMSLDDFELITGGSFYAIGDIVSFSGGEGTDVAAFQVTSVTPGAGVITDVRLLKSGVYTALPNAADIQTTSNSTFGFGARFSGTFKVSAIEVLTSGSGYGLASVLVEGGGGGGTFGFVDIIGGEVLSATVTEQGSGYTTVPTVKIELPTFRINTGGFRTDFTGAISGPSRDIREGLFLRGETSGALANILAHDGELDGDDELFDVDFIAGKFVPGERISYGDPVKNLQITIFVESGIYLENYPLKVPANVSIKGDEFRRTIIRPRDGMSTSPYSNVLFRRDPEIDGLTVATQPFGYHYLTNSLDPIHPIINNPGGFRAARQIIRSNRAFIQEETIGWINDQITNNQEPFQNFEYDQALCKRDVGLILDAIAFDLRWGGENRTVSAALKYYEGVTDKGNSLVAITTQKQQTIAAMERIKLLVDLCLDGLPPGIVYGNVPQVIDPAFVAETGTRPLAEGLIDKIIDIISDQSNFNAPKNSLDMDVFLMNDATILRNITIQGHGGFAMVLDPDGQILTKSPYAQVGTVFSGSTGFHRFAGGLFIDGFAGNVEFNPVEKDTNFVLRVGGLVRKPQTPFNFQVGGLNYRVNYIKNYRFDPAGSTAEFVLDETTPFTPSVVGNETFEAITAGNRSMLSNDFTQINDMGYGILATNGGLTEAVGMFTYYCYTAFYSLNGAQIRSVGGSSANGVYALVAEGSDPLEIPLTVTLKDNLSQGAVAYAPSEAFETKEADRFIFITNFDYLPYNQCEIEIDHSGILNVYAINNVETGGVIPAGVAKLNFSSAATSGQFAGSLIAGVPDGTPVTVRLRNQIILADLISEFGTRPSTALVFDETPNFIYRVISISTGGQAPGEALAILREGYNYLAVQIAASQPANHGGVGNTQIALGSISENDQSRVVGAQFGWKGTVYSVTGFETPAQTGESYSRITFTPGLAFAVSGFTPPATLKLGTPAGEPGEITIKISTARFTGHDLLDIGTGSYADTNYPTNIYGEPANPTSQENEVQERGKGRVFYVTTDQNGNFRVGPFFSIDQSTGTISFTADLALNNLDGLGFKRGVTVSEFSTDDSMGDNATDTVPTEIAVRGYIDRRLGLSHTGGTVSSSALIPVTTGGFMALNGALPMKGNLNMNVTNRIIGLADPIDVRDAVNRGWTKLSNLQDGTLTTPANQDLLMLTGNEGSFVNVSNNTATITNTPTNNSGGSDVALTRNNNLLTVKLVGGQGSNNPITDHHINNDAEIQQSKLLMQLAATRTAAPTGTARQRQATAGLSSFRNNEFTVSSGFVELQTSTSTSTGIDPSKLQWMQGRSVLANSSTINGSVSSVLMTDVVNFGNAIKKAQFTSRGFIRRSGGGFLSDGDYEIVDESIDATANTLVKRDASGGFSGNIVNVNQLNVDNKKVLDTSALTGTDTGVIVISSYRGLAGISLGDGATSSDRVTFYDNDLHFFRSQNGQLNGTARLGTITTGAVGTAGTITGNWSLSSTSNLTLGSGIFDARSGTLQSLTLTTGSTGTGGTITGDWSMSGTSALTLGSGGLINASAGTLQSVTLTSGAAATAGTITGNWSLSTGSNISPGNGSITATRATNVTLESANTASSTHYITFTSTATGDVRVRTDTDLTYRPDTNTLTVSTVSANLNGNADTVTNGVYTAGNQTIGGVKTFSSGPVVPNLVLGSQTSKATITYTTNAARTYNLPDAGTNADFVMTQGNQTLAGTKTFSGTIIASNTITGSISGNAATITNQANSATITAATANTANTIVLRDVNGNFSAGVITGTATTARYADLAERYRADKKYQPGTVVIFGGEFEITQSNRANDTRVAGIISTAPAYLMNSDAGGDDLYPAVALVGRVPCRVVGKIEKGDMLVTSSIAGVAVAGRDPKVGTVIGKALENYNNDHIGTIEVAVGRY